MIGLLDLPVECLHGILKEIHPADLGSLSRSCKGLNHFISGNYLLFKETYLNIWDEPPQNVEVGPYWKLQVQKFVQLRKHLESSSKEDKLENLQVVVESIHEFVQAASPIYDESRNLNQLSHFFSNLSNLLVFPCQSTIFARARHIGQELHTQSTERQLSAKLHVFFGAPLNNKWDPDSRTYPYACSKIYDLRNYRDENLWGPFLDDGSMQVDWEKLEAIMVILAHNMRLSRFCLASMNQATWTQPFAGAMANSFRTHCKPRSGPITPSQFYENLVSEANHLSNLAIYPPRDPYGVTGTWMRIVCFLDGAELEEYNSADRMLPPDEPLPPLYSTEATLLIMMTLVATEAEPPGELDGWDMPVVHFEGTSRLINSSWDPNAHAMVRGSVRQTNEGEIRWTTFSIIEGDERWRSEGVQIGGTRSARGVLGTWFDNSFNKEGPAGPTMFWKVRDDIDPLNEDDTIDE